MDQLLTIQIDFPDNLNLANVRETVFLFEQRCNAFLQENCLGEVDGDEWSGGRCIIFCYGSDANKLFTAAEEFWTLVNLSVSATVVRRFGPPGSREEHGTLPAKELGSTHH
jgi:hypothetical protein